MPSKPASNFWNSIKKTIQKERQKPPIQLIHQNSNLDIPLSYNQEQLWELDKLNPDSVHNISYALKFSLKLNFPALEKSLQEIVSRHAILRTIFPIVDGKPIQKIIAENSFQVPLLDLREIEPIEKKIQAKQIAFAAKQQPFNLIEEPGFQVKVLHLSSTEFIVLLIMHHIICDGVSLGIFFKELEILYDAFCTNQANPLPTLPIQYADFAYWERQLLENSTDNYLLRYWQNKLQGKIQSVKLPQDNFKNTVFNYQGKSQNFQLSLNLTEKIKQLGIKQGMTLFPILLTAFKTLLYCYTKQTDIILISPTQGRDNPELKNLIGYFNNLLLLRTNFENNLTFLQLLEQVNFTLLEAREHQDFPFKKFTEFPNLNGFSFSRLMFAFSNYQTHHPQLLGITPTFIDTRDIGKEQSNFDLSFSMNYRTDRLSGIVKYKTALFTENTITQLIDNFEKLLENLIDNPEIKLESLPSFLPNLAYVQNDKIESLCTNDDLENIDSNQKQELQQIETTLNQHPTIKKAIVVKSKDDSCIAYILPSWQSLINKEELKTLLLQKHPEYADTCTFLILKKLPLNQEGNLDFNVMSNFPISRDGIIDITAIPVKCWKLSSAEKTLFYPHNMTQEMIAQIWSEVLGLESFHKGISKFNIYDNFFELGGHSLATIKFIDRIWEVFNIKLDLQDLFGNPTIFGLAMKLDSIRKNSQNSEENKQQSWSHLVPIKTGGNKKPFFLIPGGGGDEKTLMFYGQLLFLLGKEQPVYGLITHNSYGEGWVSQLENHISVEKLATTYVREIRQLQTYGSYIIVGECIGGIVAFEVAQQLLKEGCQVNLLLIDTLCPREIDKLYSSKIASIHNKKSHKSLDLLSREAREYYSEIVGKYQPQSYHDKLTMIISANRICKDLALNWKHLATEGCDIYEVPGDHESYIGKFVITTAQQLKKCLNSFQENDVSFEIATDLKAELLSINQYIINNIGNSENKKNIVPTENNHDYQTIWYSLSDEERIEAIYAKALDLPQKQTSAYTLLGTVKARKKEFDQAFFYYNKALEIDPYNLGTYLQLGNTLCEQKEFEQALETYNKAQQIDPYSHENYIYQGRYYLQIGETDKAINTFEKGLQIVQNKLGLYAAKGNLQAELGQFPEALTTFNTALEIDPDNAHLHRSIANTYRKNLNYEEAITHYQKAIEIEPDNVNGYIPLGAVLVELHRIEEAKKVFYDAIKIDPDFAPPYNNLGNIQYKQGDLEAAIVSYNRSLDINPQQAGAYTALGHTFSLLNQTEEAIIVFNKALELDHNHVGAYNGLGNIRRKQGSLEAAITSYNRSLELNPQQVGVYLTLGNIFNSLNRIEEAINIVEKAKKLDPNHFGVYNNLGNIQRKQGNLEAAIIAYRRSLELNPNQFNTYTVLGVCLYQIDRPEEAIKAYQDAIKLEPNRSGVYGSLGNAYLKYGDLTKAIWSYQQAIELNSKQPFQVYKNLGDALRLQAIKSYQEALKINPDDQEVREYLDRMKIDNNNLKFNL